MKDRGMVKWTAMMLPEHQMLLKIWRQERLMEPQRERAEWELEELQQTITRALTQHHYILLTVWEYGRYRQWSGIIQAINDKELLLVTDTVTKSIPLSYIDAAYIEGDGDA
ncbi:YolD-like family protein [Lysinibacillus macroides]|uniref:YolD-like protein n=1 Tax=Lysinibacillus macroides TaxID=33935 RepID=A0A0M9DHG9_9BACI|nr:YolD-like family protein [Lysinibacillus macroides]KOY80506.1 hypothetical protein ADM90_14910 [Lysinibacillus macroides]